VAIGSPHDPVLIDRYSPARRLRCLRGVDTLTAVGLCCEIGDFESFAKAEQLMSYVESAEPAAPPAKRQTPSTDANL
jgi:hypothetical protein